MEGLFTEAERENLRSLNAEISTTRRGWREGIYRGPSEYRDLVLASGSQSDLMLRRLFACDEFLKGEKPRVSKDMRIEIIDLLEQPAFFFKGNPFSHIKYNPVDVSLIQEVMKPELPTKHEPSILWQFRPHGHVYIVQYYFRKSEFHNFAIRNENFAKAPAILHYYEHFPLILDQPAMIFRGQTIYLPNPPWTLPINRMISVIGQMLMEVTDNKGYLIPKYEKISQLYKLSSPNWWES